MVHILDGRALAHQRARVLEKMIQKKAKTRPPRLVIFMRDPHDASRSYVAQKETLAARLGVSCKIVVLPSTTEKARVTIQKTLKTHAPDGAIIQLPLPSSLDVSILANTIPAFCDVDVLSAESLGRVVQGSAEFVPPMVQSVLLLLKQAKVSLRGKHVVLIGAGALVGRPLLLALTERGATVTLCHQYTKNIAQFTKQADVIISGTGKAHLIRGGMVRRGAVVLDAGFSRRRGKIVGDVESASVSRVASAFSPVPGGIGPLTVVFLLENTLLSWIRRTSL